MSRNLCCLKPLGLWYSVTAALGNRYSDEGLIRQWGGEGRDGDGRTDSRVISEAERTQWLAECEGREAADDARFGAWLLCRLLFFIQPPRQSLLVQVRLVKLRHP